ncbi:hypothetical protein [Plantactinospora sp. KLBMP9567]|uniref:hypothetical protein n=1 Tax=Plantactinospora sp. KLBMP9567 TaxID=3085900 RepID=UPI00298183ED|nr:hypothetical protein [Plantactinospora sp. KLBMP9567]MDW5327256.1 hypothetical protein [Plantactinospora sp. KLBMP9567]
MTPLNRIAAALRRPLRIRLIAPPDKAAAALRGLAAFLHHRTELRYRRIRIDLTIRPDEEGNR